MNRWVAMLLGILFIGGGSFGFYYFMTSYEQNMTTMTTYTPTKFIPAGELITEEMIQPVTIPKAKHMDGAFLDPNQIIGKRAAVPIGEQEEFLPWKLSEKKLIPTGTEQLLSFPISYVEATNNFLRRGDEVTLWAEYKTSRITYFDQSGKKMEFTQQEISAGLIPDIANYKRTINYTEKLIDKVTVANIKDSAGNEMRDADRSTDVMDRLQSVSPAQRDAYHMEQFRMNPTGTPAQITLILTPEEYSKIIEAQSFQGVIKVGVGNPYGDLSNLADLPSLSSPVKTEDKGTPTSKTDTQGSKVERAKTEKK